MSVTTLATLPDGGGVFSAANLAATNAAISAQNANNTSLLASIASIVAGGFTATDSITALAGGAKPGTLLTSVVNRVSIAVTAGDSVSLPASSAGLICVIVNDVARSIQVYGLASDTINDVATATGIPVAATSMAVLFCPVAGKWYSIGQWALQVTNLLANNILDANGNASIAIAATATAVNGITVTNAATGNGTTNPVTIAPTGTDSAIGLTIAPKAAAGALTLGLSNGTADVVLGSSSATQSVKIGNGAGVSTVNLANVSVAGANVNVATAVTGSGITDTVAISTGNAASTGVKVVNILTGVPVTSGNNKLTMGGGVTSAATINAVVRSYQQINYIATETGANNALVAALLDASGNSVTVAAGLAIALKSSHTLQAGANTLNLNGHGTDAIKKASAPGTDVAVVAANGSILHMIFDGTVWQMVGQ